ncbi:ABC transporter substrate-binding protein [Rhizobium sp. CFBP 8762]|uniref:ABC transporter substrate-binding protein n=1 Tax=Rhizobium sp. CFBP 8762 TaxID=2775279 RepID=UPI001780FED8|nr:ABC transporter substrate-binding protein [Rhizobium sp. CFBP 8762]MBD8554315.1 ABC transporter substrate-binding protein [Rhizobium sp. CFBP 8762]
MAFRIGHHPNNLHLRLASVWPGAFAGLKAEFVAYPEGRDTADLLKEGAIDIGGTGSTPPILAEASGLAVRYVAASSPRPANGAILVRESSIIQNLADLKEQPVALVDGSFLTYFLAKRLEEGGLMLKDVQRLDMAPGASRDALQSGAVSAWVAMAPHLQQSLATGEFRVLADCGSLIPNRSLFWTINERGVRDEVLDAFASELQQLGNAIAADPEKAAELLSTNDDPAERRAWTRVVAERNWHVAAADTLVLREQQAEADTLFHHGDLAAPLTIKSLHGEEI